MDIVKQYADERNLQALKYVFVNALEVDPTFDHYKEKYNYCKSIPNLLEPYAELTPFVEDKNKWDEAYWDKLKIDLLKNFSDKRMMHMVDVAQVVRADKIKRLRAERAAAAKAAEQEKKASPSSVSSQKPHAENAASKQTHVIGPKQQEQAKRFEELRKQNAEERQKQEEPIKQPAKHPEEHQSGRENTSYKPLNTERNHSNSKKAMGIALAAAAVVAAVVIVAIIVK